MEPTPQGVVRAASLISLGNFLSRFLGFLLEILIPFFFGATGLVSVFRVAETLSQSLYDLIVGGLVSAAFVPVFSEYAERREELWGIASVVLSVFGVLLAIAVVLLEIFAEPLFTILGPGYSPELQRAGILMLRLIMPAVFFLGIAGILSGLLYSLKRFALPAFVSTAYNACVILTLLFLVPQLGILSLVVGIVLGAGSQVLLQLPGIRDAHLHFSFNLKHPALRRILLLYLPVVGGTAVALIGVAIDRNLASRTGQQSVAWMQQATVLVQFPLGLVVTAISLAILPNLARAFDPGEFRGTLAFGLKLVLILILPATVGLFLLAQPIITVLFEHGRFTPQDTEQTTSALKLYLLGLPFAAIDQPLVFGFYARKNTLTPNLVAVVGLATYLVVALLLIQPLGYLGLVIANSGQLAAHALVMLYLTQTRLGGIRGVGLTQTLIKVVLATGAMGVVLVGLQFLNWDAFGIFTNLAQVLISLGIACFTYTIAIRFLRVREAQQIWGQLRGRMGY